MQNIKSHHHELLKAAIEATDAYLGIEKTAKKLGYSTANMNVEFISHVKRVYDILNKLGELPKHEDYIKFHIQEMIDLTPELKGQEAILTVSEPAKINHQMFEGRSFRINSLSTFILEEKKTTDEVDFTEEEIDRIVDNLDWEDIIDLYDEEELVFDDSDDEDDDSEDEEDDDLNEKISLQSRIRKKQAFARMSGRRNAARNIKLRRASSMEVLKKRANLSARRAVYKRLLRNRDKSTLSATEMDRIESQVGRLKFLQVAIANKMLPKMRGIEQKRLAGFRSRQLGGSGKLRSKAPGGTSSKRGTGSKAPGGTSGRRISSSKAPEGTSSKRR